MRKALELALEALQVATTPLAKDRQEVLRAIAAIKEALAQPEEEKLHPVHIGVDVTKEGTAVTAFYRKPDAVMEMFYSQFYPMAQPERDYERGFIDGMQKQMQSSVDKAVNRMTRKWVGLTEEEYKNIRYGSDESGERYVNYTSL